MCLGFKRLHFHNAPAPEVFISHLLCLAQIVDSAGLFGFFLVFFFFLGKRLLWALFLSLSRPLWLYIQFLSRKEAKVTNGSLKVSLLYLRLRSKPLNEKISASQEDCTGRFLTLEKEWLFPISKYQRVWINPHSKVVSPLMRKNGMTLVPSSRLLLYKESQAGDTPGPLYWFKDT